MQVIRAGMKQKLLILLCVCSLCSCGRDSLPEYAPDIISTTYQNMSDIKTFRIHGKLTLVMRLSGKEHTYMVDTTAVSLEDPREITVKMESGEKQAEKEVRFLYYEETLSKESCFLFQGDSWIEESKEEISEFEDPVPFGAYLSQKESFHKVAEEDGVACLQGTVSGNSIVYALEESGVLKRFSLTGLTEEMANALEPVQVKLWVENKGEMIIKMEADMTETVKKMATLLYDKNGVAGPEILSCSYAIDSITLNKVVELPLPEQAEKVLRDALK